MSTLHTLSALPHSEACEDCLRLLADGDALLLMGDGVYAAPLAPRSEGIEVFVLASDAKARGVEQSLSDLEHIDMGQFVQLTTRFPRQLAWY